MNFKVKVMGKIYIYLYTLICTLLQKLFSHISGTCPKFISSCRS